MSDCDGVRTGRPKLDLPTCCEKCHEGDDLTTALLDGRPRRLCCALFSALFGDERVVFRPSGVRKVAERTEEGEERSA